MSDNELIKNLEFYCLNLKKTHFVRTGNYIESIEIQEMISEAFSKSFNTFEDAKKIIRSFFLTEIRVLSAKYQKQTISSDYQKTCKHCKELKIANEFTVIVDSRTGFTYLKSLCKECVSEIGETPERKAKRIEYRKTDRAKMLAHKRYLAYKKRQLIKKQTLN